MMKRKNVILIFIVASILSLQIGCGSTEASVDQTEEIETNETNETNEINVEDISETVEETSVQESRPKMFLEGYRYDENGTEMNSVCEPVFAFNQLQGCERWGGRSYADGYVPHYRFVNDEMGYVLVIAWEFDNDQYIKACLRAYLGSGMLLSTEENLYSNNTDEIITSLETKDEVDTPYGKMRILYMLSDSQELGEGVASEIVMFNAAQQDIVIRCTYNEKEDYRGILNEQLPLMFEEQDGKLETNFSNVSYGDYEYICGVGNGDYHEIVMGYNAPDGYKYEFDKGAYYSNPSLLYELRDSFSNDTVSIMISNFDREYYADLINFLETGEYEEGKEDEYGNALVSMDQDSVKTIYGTAQIVWQITHFASSYIDDMVEEYAIFNINGYEILFYCSYYEPEGKYRGVLKDLLPEMTER